MARRLTLTTTILLIIAISGNAFMSAGRGRRAAAVVTTPQTAIITTTTTSSSQLHERRWNFNEGQSPWGLKRNAETWNGRVAQMAFVGVVLQELIQGKGIVHGLQESDPVNLAFASGFLVFLVAFTAFLALKGDDDYVTRYLEENNYSKP